MGNMLRNLRKMFGGEDAQSRQGQSDAPAAAQPAVARVFSQNLLTCSQLGQTLVVTVIEPELNHFKAAEINAEVRRLMTEHPSARNLVIDMGNIEYLDSAGLNAFVDLLSVVRPTGGRIAIAAATQQVEVLFKLTRLELIFTIRREVIEAVDALEKAG